VRIDLPEALSRNIEEEEDKRMLLVILTSGGTERWFGTRVDVSRDGCATETPRSEILQDRKRNPCTPPMFLGNFGTCQSTGHLDIHIYIYISSTRLHNKWSACQVRFRSEAPHLWKQTKTRFRYWFVHAHDTNVRKISSSFIALRSAHQFGIDVVGKVPARGEWSERRL
jgi:hypothetical protein